MSGYDQFQSGADQAPSAGSPTPGGGYGDAHDDGDPTGLHNGNPGGGTVNGGPGGYGNAGLTTPYGQQNQNPAGNPS